MDGLRLLRTARAASGKSGLRQRCLDTGNILSRGPLGGLYRVWGDGREMVKGDRTDYFGLTGYTTDQAKKMGYMVWMPPQEKGSFLGEGDTPTFLNLLDNGLRAYENRRWSGWGGSSRSWNVPAVGLEALRSRPPVPEDPGIAIGLAAAGSNANKNSKTTTAPAGPVAGDSGDSVFSIPATNAAANARFFAAAQNDFAARLKWSVTPKFADANHEPKVRLRRAAGGSRCGPAERFVWKERFRTPITMP